MSLNETPSANRLHIGIFGKVNSGKSSFINAFTGQEVSIVSDVAGTTTDLVTKAMEILPLGPCVLIDTAGFDDTTILGEVRKERTRLAAEKSDIAVIVFSTASDSDLTEEMEWYSYFQQKKIPVIAVINEVLEQDVPIEQDKFSGEAMSSIGSFILEGDSNDELDNALPIEMEISDEDNINFSTLLIEEKFDLYIRKSILSEAIKAFTETEPICINAKTGEGIEAVKEALVRKIPEDFELPSITGSLVKESDVVMLVMPQDIQAPKGRLILPQVQTIRDLLDKKCIVMSVTTDKMAQALEQLKQPPKLIIVDSQVFKIAYELKPKESMLTSFSVLFAAYKGDLPYYIEGAKAIDTLTENSKVLIAECCTHAPLSEDIGRVKIPNMLRKRFGAGLTVDMVSGTDFPKDLQNYDLIIQCGGCMFNRKYIMSRIDRAKQQEVPMTNYGVTIAHLTGILDKISVN